MTTRPNTLWMFAHLSRGEIEVPLQFSPDWRPPNED